jgi:hypothetical protein
MELLMSCSQKPIFIHIPKTGGTSINCVMKNTPWQTTLDFHYRHLDFDTKTSTCGDIFELKNKNTFVKEFIFMMLRHPIDRLISEYYYIRKNHEFMGLLSTAPSCFEEYIDNPQTANYMLKFLDGQQIYNNNEITLLRAKEIINLIDELDIHVGIFEEYNRSLAYFSDVGDFQWPEKLAIKRATLNRPTIQQVSPAIQAKIIAKNQLDIMLYEHCRERLLARTQQLEITKIKHTGGKLDFVIPYTLWNCILDIELQNRSFIEENKTFFVTLNTYLHKTTDNGKDYAKNWLKLFKKSVALYFKGSKFAKQIKQISRRCPIDEIIEIAKIIDYASSSPSLGLDLGQAKIKLPLTSVMADAMTGADRIEKGRIQW